MRYSAGTEKRKKENIMQSVIIECNRSVQKLALNCSKKEGMFSTFYSRLASPSSSNKTTFDNCNKRKKIIANISNL